MQLDSNLEFEFENMKFEHETPKQVTCGNKLVDLPLCINNLHALMPIVKNFKMNYKGGLLL
jgi:hypothetical protein